MEEQHSQALDLIARTTKDIDLLGVLIREKNQLIVKEIKNFPPKLQEAIPIVERDFGLPHNWINNGPTSQVSLGLPMGFTSRLIKREFGKALIIYFISRLDQIHFKLFASLDRGGYHVEDLLALKPTHDEMLLASRWVLTQDVSEEFKIITKDFLSKQGFSNVAEKI